MQRIFKFKNTFNFREMGGYPTNDHRKIRYHKLLRAGNLSELEPSELDWLNNYGLRYSVDFRSDFERHNWPDPKVPFLKLLPMPLYPDSGATDSKLYDALPKEDQYDDLAGLYQQIILDPHAQHVFRKFFKVLLENGQPEQSVVFHCSAGKDRTGITAILFLLLMNVPEDYIVQDYLLTNLMYAQNNDLSALNNSNSEKIQKMNFTQADRSAVDAIKAAIIGTYQSLKNFRTDILDISEENYQTLRKLYTEPNQGKWSKLNEFFGIKKHH